MILANNNNGNQVRETEMTNETHVKENHMLFGKCGQPLFTSDQAAACIGITRAALITLLSRHDGLRPSIKVGQDWFWSDGEIAAVAEKKAGTKRGRPAKN